MRAMLLTGMHEITGETEPLVHSEVPVPEPGEGELLLRVLACGVCHTELDEIEGRTPPAEYPVVPGHEVVGRVVETGRGVDPSRIGQRVGVGWFYSSCGSCSYCLEGRQNLCRDFRATGRDADGGYAEFMKVPAGSAFPVPEGLDDVKTAPLLCAGAIGYRSLRLSGIRDGDPLGLTGFGGSAHLVLKMVREKFPSTEVFVFARDPGEREFAMELGAAWAGNTSEASPRKLRAIIDTTPVWKPVVEALDDLAPGGRLVINAIRKEDSDRHELLRIDYARDIWMEKEIKSVANVTPRDISEFLELAAELGLEPETAVYRLDEAGRALRELRSGGVRGAKVLVMN